jgi:tetratricopeptide (TPR) repeat protein
MASLSSTGITTTANGFVASSVSSGSGPPMSTFWEIRLQQKRQAPIEGRLAFARPVNPRAYEAYIKGRFHFDKRTEPDLRTAIDYFNRVIAADPQYALAYVGLADSYNILGSRAFTAVSREEARTQAMMFANRALEIDDTLGEAHTSLASAKILFDCEWKGSEAEFQRAVTLNPNYASAHFWYAELLIDWGRFDESLRESYKAKELDPLSAIIHGALAYRLCVAGRCDEGMREALAALELDADLPITHYILANDTYRREGKFAEAIAEMRKDVQLSSNNPNFVADLAALYAVSGDRRRAHEILTQLREISRKRYVAPYQLAVIYLRARRQAKSVGSAGPGLQGALPVVEMSLFG